MVNHVRFPTAPHGIHDAKNQHDFKDGGRMIDMVHRARKLEIIEEFQKVEIETKIGVPKKWQKYADPQYKGGEVDADEVTKNIRKMLEYLDNHGYKRSSEQVQAHDAMLCASMRFIYRDKFFAKLARILKDNMWKEIRQEILITAIRRFGKTFSVVLLFYFIFYIFTSIYNFVKGIALYKLMICNLSH